LDAGGFGAQRREQLRKCVAFEIVGGVDIREEAFIKAGSEGFSLRDFACV
jgi:hypothetical protein